MVTPLGESQADHRNAGQKWTLNVQLLQYQGIVGVFLCIRSTFKLLYFVKRNAVKKNGNAPIIARITVEDFNFIY